MMTDVSASILLIVRTDIRDKQCKAWWFEIVSAHSASKQSWYTEFQAVLQGASIRSTLYTNQMLREESPKSAWLATRCTRQVHCLFFLGRTTIEMREPNPKISDLLGAKDAPGHTNTGFVVVDDAYLGSRLILAFTDPAATSLEALLLNDIWIPTHKFMPSTHKIETQKQPINFTFRMQELGRKYPKVPAILGRESPMNES